MLYLVSENFNSRRRKTKCNGVRPKCGHCTSRKIPCEWPRAAFAVLSNPPSTTEAATVSQRHSAEPVLHPEITVSDSGLPSRPALQRCLSQFFKRHFSNEFCSFSYRPQFEDKAMAHPFLATAIVSLCARYLSVHDAQREFGRASKREVYKDASTLAKRFARSSSDQPSGTSNNPLESHKCSLPQSSTSRQISYCPCQSFFLIMDPVIGCMLGPPFGWLRSCDSIKNTTQDTPNKNARSADARSGRACKLTDCLRLAWSSHKPCH